MASRSAMVLVILVVAVIAFCFAGVFAAMTGTYHLNLDFGNNTTENSGFLGNMTEFNSGSSNSGSSSSNVQTYEDTSSSSSSSSSSSNVETKEETQPVASEQVPETSTGNTT